MRIPPTLLALSSLAALTAHAAVVSTAREELRLDEGWHFRVGDAPDAATTAPAAPAWAPVTLPHDWSITQRVSQLAPGTGNMGFFPGTACWYSRELQVPASWAGKRVSLRLDGAYRLAEVWLDGEKLAYQPYGYTPLVVDLPATLEPGKSHRLAVRTDNAAQPNSRWYSGTGLYRHAWLTVTNPIAIAQWGVFVQVESLSKDSARLCVQTRVENRSDKPARLRVEQVLRSDQGVDLASASGDLELEARLGIATELTLETHGAEAWTPAKPTLHTLVTRLWQGDILLDEVSTRTGLRTVSWDAVRGLLLNGEPVKLNGGNVHHDNGPLGAAAFDRAEERKVELLKQAGFNAVRTSHNPPSTAFLDACDRLGLLVMDESFDGWKKKKTTYDQGRYFEEWAEKDVASMVLRDRNHPSIVMWSTGNEVFERGEASGAEISGRLAKRIRSLDTTRPITAGINDVPGNWPSTDALFSHLDFAGYNYLTERLEEDRARIPGRAFVLTESYQSEAFKNSEAIARHPWVVGDFVWSAIDYLGESGIGRVYAPGEAATDHWVSDQWPWHGAACGDIDFTGWRKPSSHWRAVSWGQESLYASVIVPSPSGKPWSVTKWAMPPSLPTWSWPGASGRKLQIEVFSSHPWVRALVNGKVLAMAPSGRAQQCRTVLDVIHESGELLIEGLNDKGEVLESFTLPEAGEASQLVLTADRTTPQADGQDLCYVTLELRDANGHWQPHTDLPITYRTEGPATIAGIGSGDLTNQEAYFDNPRRSYQGRAIVILRTTKQPGTITLWAKAPGLPEARVEIRSR